MIQKWYEITCDYCLSGIGHYIGSKNIVLSLAEADGVFIKGNHHFCSKECYQKWLDNDKQSF